MPQLRLPRWITGISKNPIVRIIPFAGDAATLVNTYIESRNAGLDPGTSLQRSAAKAGTGLTASYIPGGDIATSAPVVLSELRDLQRRRIAEAQAKGDKFQEALVQSHPNPLRRGNIMPRPDSATGQAFQDFLQWTSPENWALQIADALNPATAGRNYSMDPVVRAEEIKEELLRRAAAQNQ